MTQLTESHTEVSLTLIQGWRLVLQEMITLGADLHPIDQSSRTPFVQVLNGFIHKWDLDTPVKSSIESGVKIWLCFLQSCGVDLSEYRKREEESYEQGLVGGEIRGIQHRGSWATAKIASFTYGNSPSDWHFKMECKFLEPGQDYGQEPGKVEEMPGGWIED